MSGCTVVVWQSLRSLDEKLDAAGAQFLVVSGWQPIAYKEKEGVTETAHAG